MSITRRHQEARDNLATLIKRYREDLRNVKDLMGQSTPLEVPQENVDAALLLKEFEDFKKTTYTWSTSDWGVLKGGRRITEEDVCVPDVSMDFLTTDQATRMAYDLLGWAMFILDPRGDDED